MCSQGRIKWKEIKWNMYKIIKGYLSGDLYLKEILRGDVFVASRRSVLLNASLDMNLSAHI